MNQNYILKEIDENEAAVQCDSKLSHKELENLNCKIQFDRELMGMMHLQIYGYRMSLWAEHLGMILNCFKEPQTLDCVKKVNKMAEENWKRFTSDAYFPLQGHLLKYPIQVDVDGKVRPLPGHETFPDFGGKVLGARTNLPDALTT